jgi:ribose transport system substrate-binding protein
MGTVTGTGLRKLLLAVVVMAALVVVVAGCGGSSSSSSSGEAETTASSSTTTETKTGTEEGEASTVSATPPSSGCGSISLPKTEDSDHVLSSLPAETHKAFEGWDKVQASNWSEWKPSHSGPDKVVVLLGPSVNAFNPEFEKLLKAEIGGSSLVGSGNISFESATSSTASGQIQQYDSAVAEKPDLIVVEPNVPPAMIQAIEAAAKAGIPTVSTLDEIDTPDAVSVNFNGNLGSALATSLGVRIGGSKGAAVVMRGFPTATTDISETKALENTLKSCPEMNLAAELIGGFEPNTAKSEMIKYLAGKPEEVSVVQQNGGMGEGVIEAFESTGRPVPTLIDMGPTSDSLGYWRQNQSTYEGVALGNSAAALAAVTSDTVLAMLEGRGPKINSIPLEPELITNENIDEWAESDWTLTGAPLLANGPESAIPPSTYIDPFFEKKGE